MGVGGGGNYNVIGNICLIFSSSAFHLVQIFRHLRFDLIAEFVLLFFIFFNNFYFAFYLFIFSLALLLGVGGQCKTGPQHMITQSISARKPDELFYSMEKVSAT